MQRRRSDQEQVMAAAGGGRFLQLGQQIQPQGGVHAGRIDALLGTFGSQLGFEFVAAAGGGWSARRPGGLDLGFGSRAGSGHRSGAASARAAEDGPDRNVL